MAAFPRTILPRTCSWPERPAPLVSTTIGSKVETRQTGAVGVRWTEHFAPMNANLQATRIFLSEINRLWSSGTNFTITPYEFSTLSGAQGATGTLATGSTGLVNGASQTGASLITDGWSAGTILQGDYITAAGVGYSLWLTADKTVSAGAITFALSPSIASGDEPADNAVVTVNGPLTAKIISKPNLPTSLTAIDWYQGLSITFVEDI